MLVGQMPVREARATLDRYTRLSLPERVVSTMSRSPAETTQDKTHRTEIKISDSDGNRAG